MTSDQLDRNGEFPGETSLVQYSARIEYESGSAYETNPQSISLSDLEKSARDILSAKRDNPIKRIIVRRHVTYVVDVREITPEGVQL